MASNSAVQLPATSCATRLSLVLFSDVEDRGYFSVMEGQDGDFEECRAVGVAARFVAYFGGELTGIAGRVNGD